MRYGLCFSIVLLLSPFAAADNVYLRNGFSIINCAVVDTVDGRIVVRTTDRERRFPLVIVQEIVKSHFEKEVPTKYYENEKEVFPNDEAAQLAPQPQSEILEKPALEYRTTFPRGYLVPIGIGFVALSIDYLNTASDAQSALDKIGDYNQRYPNARIDTGDLETLRTRKSVVGYICLAVGIGNVIFGLIPEKVEVKPTFSGLSMSYSF